MTNDTYTFMLWEPFCSAFEDKNGGLAKFFAEAMRLDGNKNRFSGT